MTVEIEPGYKGASVLVVNKSLKVTMDQTTPGSTNAVSIVPKRTVKNAFGNIAASQTDSQLVAAVGGKKIRVLSVVAIAGATATNLTFNSKGGGAGVAISMLFANGANGGFVLPRGVDDTSDSGAGWFETTAGEALTVTTGAGSTTGIQIKYCEV